MIQIFMIETPNARGTSHAFQQRILGHVLNCTPSDIAIARNGKPICTSHPVYFSVSHNLTHFAMAVSDAPVGLDIESIHRPIHWAVLNRGQDTPITNQHPNWPKTALPLAQERVLVWTRFEAQCKLTGSGIRFPIQLNAAWPLRSFVWQDLCCSVACQAPNAYVTMFALVGAQNASQWCGSMLTPLTHSDVIWPLALETPE